MRYAIIVAGGSSLRFGKDKLNEPLLGKTVLESCVDVFCTLADKVVVVGRRVEGALFAEGGATRFQSVQNGLAVLPDDGVVAIHDGARPFVLRSFAENLFAEAEKFGSAVPRVPLSDTIYCAVPTPVVARREDYFAVQTPQVFDCAALKKAYAVAVGDFTDDSAVFASDGNTLHFCDGLQGNCKLTYQGDLPRFRVGNGFDVHPFCTGSGFVLGGVRIPFDRSLAAHSDGDVLCHALCDAVLGACGLGDIGHFFPDSDKEFENIDSTLLLKRCLGMALELGFEPVNLTAAIICQQPKISPHIDNIKKNLARLMQISPTCVGISATTTEHLGVLGNGDGIAVEASVLLRG